MFLISDSPVYSLKTQPSKKSATTDYFRETHYHA